MSVEDADTNTSPEESEPESASTSEGTNESTDTSNSSSSSDSDEGQEDEETSTGSEGSAESWDQESNQHVEEDILAKKREDFDKIQEVAAHMDNVFRRLSSFFPHTEDYSHRTSQPRAVPVLPSLPPRNKTMERGVSARKLAVHHDVSVASDSYFNGGFPGGYRGKRSQQINEGQSGSRGCLGQAEDEVKRRFRVKNRMGRDTTVNDARGRMAQWNIETDSCAESPSMGIRPPSPGEKRGSYDVGMMHSGHCEHMLWDELRDSLVGREGSLSGRRTLGSGEIRRDRAAQEKRRGLINEAIRVLLEPSSEEEDMKSN